MKLDILIELDYYDGPLLFSAQDPDQENDDFFWLAILERRERTGWEYLGVEITKSEYEGVLEKKGDLREFCLDESKRKAMLVWQGGEHLDLIKFIKTEELTESMLPSTGFEFN